MNFLTKRYWSPYLCGFLIGLLQIPVFLLVRANIGASGAFQSFGCSILSWFRGDDVSNLTSTCFPAMKSWWQFAFVIGILIGAYISSRLSKSKCKNISPVWSKVLQTYSLSKRLLMAFCGGFIMLLGARIADGCTSGNGISGIALLSFGSMIVITSMFIGGIIFVQLYKKI